MKKTLAVCALGVLLFSTASGVFGQSLGNAGTIEGTVLDPSGAAIAHAQISIHNALTDHRQSTVSDANGAFKLGNIPPNPYHMEVTATGFNVHAQDVDIRNSVPVQVKIQMELAGSKTSVTVEGAGADLL